MPRHLSLALLGLAALVACKGDDGDGLFDRDSGGGIFGGDNGGGGGEVDPPDCDDDQLSTDPPGGPDCVTGTISCGDSIEGTTEGGSNQIEGEVYEDSYCFVPFEDYDGPERAYELELPEYTIATIYYSFPCQDMAIAAFRWSSEECPTLGGETTFVCEGDGLGRSGSVEISYELEDKRFLVVVDAPEGTEAPFALRVECESVE
jgi:hypothetical protein